MILPSSKRLKVISTVIIVFVLICSIALLASHPLRRNGRITFEALLAHVYSTPDTPFPEIPSSNLSDTQLNIIRITKQEYLKKPVSFDANVQKYSQGYKEAWCANFASWVMKEADHPFTNPNSDSWRIPGVNTLQEYFQNLHLYRRAGNYTPSTGDTAIYLENGRGHTNIVLSVSDKYMTTVGGNETGHLRLNTQPYSFGSQGLSGFGILKTD